MTGYMKWLRFCQDNNIDIKFESGNLVNHEELINISDFCLTTSTREGFGMAFLESWLAGTPVIGRDIPCVTNDLRKAGIHFPRLYSGITVKSGTQVKDFKDFTSGEQEEIIKEVLLNTSSRSRILRDNPFLGSLLDDIPAEMILENQVVVKNEFSLEKYGEKLLAIYRDVSA
jgi:glycosyltransferase involved in cell wall biosynthesis